MANELNQAPPPPPGFSPVQSAPPPPPGFAPVATQASGEVLPPDVAARHARSVTDARARGLRTDLPDQEDFMDKVRTGVGKTAVESASGLANLANKVLPSSLQIPTEQHTIETTLPAGPVREQALAGAKEELTPHGLGENVGATAENVVEWMGGEAALKGLGLGAKLAKMKKVADFVEEYPRIAKLLHIGTNIAKSSTIGATQGAIKGSSSGGEGTLQGAESGAAGGAIGGVVAEAAPVVTQKLGSVLEQYAPDFMNSLMRAKKGSFLYGRNPGQAIIDEGINAPKSPTLAGQLENIHGQLEAAGEDLDSQIKQTLNQPSVAAKKQDIVPFVQSTIEAAKQKVVNQTGIDTKAYLNELTKLEESIFTKYDTDGNKIANIKNWRLSPAEISDVKKSIGRNTQWNVFKTDPDYKLKTAVNDVRHQLYGGLKEMVENAAEEGAPGSKIGELNARYANVIEAQGLLENRISYEHGTGGWAAAARKGSWAAALLGIFSGNPIEQAGGTALLANRISRSAPGSVLEARGAAAVGKGMQSPVVGKAAQVAKPAIANWVRMTLGDGQNVEVHPEDVAEVQRRDTGAKVLSQENQ